MTLRWQPPLAGTGADYAAIWNALFALADRTIPLDEAGTSMQMTPVERPQEDVWVTTLLLRGSDVPIAVAVTEFPFRQMFDVDLDAADIAALPEGLRQAVLEGIIATLATMLPVEVARSGDGLLSSLPAFQDEKTQWFSVLLRRDGAGVFGAIVGADRSELVRLLAGRLTGNSPLYDELADGIMAAADTTIGRIALARRELKSLEPGAVVVMAERLPDVVQVRVQGWLFEFSRSERGLLCTKVEGHEAGVARLAAARHYRESDMDDEATGVETPEETTIISEGDLEVTLDFDIGRTSVPLSVLTQWRSGSVVEFDPPIVADGLEVTIRSNGDIVGIGDVVRIDDRLAVRITRFLLRS